MSTEQHLNLTNPNTGDSLQLSPRELTQIFDSLMASGHIDLEIKLGSFLDNQGIPTA